MSRRELTAVYVISAGENGPCKIGMSKDPDARLANLQTASPVRLQGEMTFWFPTRARAEATEAELHRVFAQVRLEGEWFDVRVREAHSQIPSFVDYWGGELEAA